MADPVREAMLNRIRQQLSGEVGAGQAAKPRVASPAGASRTLKGVSDLSADYHAIPRNYQRVGQRTAEETIALFIDRLEDYDAHVVRTPAHAVSAAVGEMLKGAGHARVLVPAAFPESWLPADAVILRDRSSNGEVLTHSELDTIHAVLTTCAAAIASTGTLLLVHGADQGRRAITLLPDYYVCVVRSSDIVETVPEGLAKIASAPAARLLPITTVSGPSATSDIEMTRIRGVHGPRQLGIVIVDGA